ncbi:FHA domain-containing serine/threonine-protein kinase [Anaerolineales bacterium HSG25]|nr:FHA domain-containing serine/threonine-protein kinase [Anaerolineales bacterium HSG25]
MQDLIGRTFGGYELKEHVGAGGMASIYRGYDEGLSRWVAIKVMDAQASSSAEETLLARFRLEAQAIAKLRHPNILTIYGYGEDDGWAYIIMEYVPGGSLEDRLENKTFTPRDTLDIIIPVAEALALAHKYNIIHRDIKPANILMSDNDWPLLADFGLAKMQQSNAPGLTMPGQVLGTMAYAAPEQIEEGEMDHRVDIYSLGVVLYEMLTDKLPFHGETSFDFLMARLTDPPIPLLTANPSAPEEFVPILDMVLAQSPDGRYQTMDEFVLALNQARRAIAVGSSHPNIPSQSSSTPTPPPRQTKIHLRLTATQETILTADSNSQANMIIGRAFKSRVPDVDLGPHGASKAGVSRQHSRLLRIGSDWFVEDLGSTNGTYVNGIRVGNHQMQMLQNRDLIRCGHLEFAFELDG